MKPTLKATAAILGMLAAAWLTVEALICFMWLCYYAGIRM